MAVEVGVGLALALLVLVSGAVVVARLAGLPLGRAVVGASARAVLQLAAAALVITAALSHLWLALLVVAGMFAVAVLTASRRCEVGTTWPWLAAAILAGWLPVLLVVFATGVAPVRPETVVPFGGILLGGTMSAVSLAVRRATAALRDGRPELEAGLALGLRPGASAAEVVAPVTAEALYPALDQTRTVGLVTLPGAFIGVLLAGGSPVDAAAAQVLVLVGLLCAEMVGVVVSSRLVSEGRLVPRDLAGWRHLWA